MKENPVVLFLKFIVTEMSMADHLYIYIIYKLFNPFQYNIIKSD